MMECNKGDASSNKKQKKAKVSREWEDDEVFRLIATVETEKCIWDAGEEGYHNKVLRALAWQNICDLFDEKFTVPELTAKWTNLRIQFRTYAARAKTKSGQGVEETPKWKFYNALLFIGRVEDQQTQNTISNLTIEDTDSNSPGYSLTLSPSFSTQRPTPRGNNQSVATHIAETMREAVSAIKERSQNSFDANINFANYLLSELKTLSEESAASVRKKVTLFFLECVEEERKPK